MFATLLAFAFLSFTTYRANLESLEKLNQENVSWTAFRLESELNNFLRSIYDLKNGTAGANPDVVNDKFDILWSRLVVTETGVVGDTIQSYDTETKTVNKLFDLVKKEETAVVTLTATDTATIDHLIQEFAAVQPDISQFSRIVFFGENARISSVRGQLLTTANLFALSTIAAFIIGSIVLVIITRQSRHNKNMAETNLELAKAFRSANEAKSRFLTMMSHELRTPMNGVLGMLSLARNSGLSVPQNRLIEQAERSGMQMVDMLSDILDFAALQDEEMTFEQRPFDPDHLAAAIQELFGSIAKREGIEFEVICAPTCPAMISGDFKRLRQVVAHLASYIVETAGTRRLTITIDHADDRLKANISFDHQNAKNPSDGWADLLTGSRPHEGKNFATDALGPAVARSILDRMGGSLALDHKGDLLVLVVEAPAPELVTDLIKVFVDAQSESLRTICTLALPNDTFLIADTRDDGPIHAVLIESGGPDEVDRVQKNRDLFPNAIIIAIGHPKFATNFDAVTTLPIDVPMLQTAVVNKARLKNVSNQ